MGRSEDIQHIGSLLIEGGLIDQQKFEAARTSLQESRKFVIAALEEEGLLAINHI